MMKFSVLAIILLFCGYFYSTDEKYSQYANDDDDYKTMKEKKSHLFNNEDFQKAVKKIVVKKENEEGNRLPTSDPAEFIDKNTYSDTPSDADYVEEFKNLNPIQVAATIKNLETELQLDQDLLTQMEIDKSQGLNITDDDIAAISQRTENKRYKLNFFKSLLNENQEN